MPPARPTSKVTTLPPHALAVLWGIDATLDPSDPDAVEHAVRDFQALAGVEVSGQLDPATTKAIDETAEWADAVAAVVVDRPTLQRGDTGPEVLELQRLIQAPLTSTFDADTERRVRRVQGRNGRPQTGIADAEVWALADR